MAFRPTLYRLSKVFLLGTIKTKKKKENLLHLKHFKLRSQNRVKLNKTFRSAKTRIWRLKK